MKYILEKKDKKKIKMVWSISQLNRGGFIGSGDGKKKKEQNYQDHTGKYIRCEWLVWGYVHL